MISIEFVNGFIVRSENRLKQFRRTGLFFKLALFFASLLVMIGKGFEEGAGPSFVVYVLVFLFLLILPIPSRTFIPTKTWLQFSEEYYNSILSIIQSEFSEVTSIAPIGECDVRMVNYSGLMHSSYEGFVGGNKICGEMDGCVFELCYAKIYEELSCCFCGYYFQLEMHKQAEDKSEEIQKFASWLWQQAAVSEASVMRLSIKGNHLFIVVESSRNLFGCKTMKQLKKTADDVQFFAGLFGFLKDVSVRAIEVKSN